MADGILTQARLKELLHYDPNTGLFKRRVTASNNAKAGSIAGCVSKFLGYRLIGVDRKPYYAHRLAWLYVHGTLPPDQIDHINRVKTDNRICNLRLATDAENRQNMPMPSSNTSGHVGVHWFKRCQKWTAYIQIDKKTISLGYFNDIDDAIAARKAAEVKFHRFQNTKEASK